jgi:hypothetical protein
VIGPIRHSGARLFGANPESKIRLGVWIPGLRASGRIPEWRGVEITA